MKISSFKTILILSIVLIVISVVTLCLSIDSNSKILSEMGIWIFKLGSLLGVAWVIFNKGEK